VVDGFVSADEADDYVAEEDFDEFDEEDDDDGKGGSKALTKKLEELKNQALESSTLRAHFDKMRKAYREGRLQLAPYNKASSHQRRPDDHPLHGQDHREAVRHAALQVDDVRRYEREIRKIVVDKCGMPQDHFIKTFPPNVLNLKWAEKEIAPASPTAPSWAATCRPSRNCSRS
jgi:RNA polymerase primary sigma factor